MKINDKPLRGSIFKKDKTRYFLKAQLISQVFVYVVSALVFILVLLFGYRAVSSLGEKQESVILFQFMQDLVSSIDDMCQRYGSVDIEDFSFPKSIRELCFITDKALVNDLPLLKDNRPGIHSSWVSSSYNIFSLPSADVRLRIPNLDVQRGQLPLNYCCFKVSGKISLRFEGAGRTVILSSGNPDVYECGN